MELTKEDIKWWVNRINSRFTCRICGYPKNIKETFQRIMLSFGCNWEQMIKHIREEHPQEFKEELLPLIQECQKLNSEKGEQVS